MEDRSIATPADQARHLARCGDRATAGAVYAARDDERIGRRLVEREPGVGPAGEMVAVERLRALRAEGHQDRRLLAALGGVGIDVDEVDRGAVGDRACSIRKARRIEAAVEPRVDRGVEAESVERLGRGTDLVDDQAVGRQQRQIEAAVVVAAQIVRIGQVVKCRARVDGEQRCGRRVIARRRCGEDKEETVAAHGPENLAPSPKSTRTQKLSTTTPPTSKPPPAAVIATA